MLADDDPDDRMFFEDAIAEMGLNINLQMVDDGEELMKYLLTSAILLPQILFLDLNMPIKNGFKCLEEIRANKAFQDLFVIIYSTTVNGSHVDEAYKLGANLFIRKPNSYTDLKKILTKIFSLDLKQQFAKSKRERFVFEL